MGHAAQMSLDYCEYTCPAVDYAFSQAEDALRPFVGDEYDLRNVSEVMDTLLVSVKAAGTEKLRAGLVKACEDIMELEAKVKDLERQLEMANDAE